MSLILGIDAAWTQTGSSGVALLEQVGRTRRVIACAPSYTSFIDYSTGVQTDWHKHSAGPLDVSALLTTATRLGRGPIEVVAIDMPIAANKILRRRVADQKISKEFGGAWASTHGPTGDRPGQYGHDITAQFLKAGFSLTTKKNPRSATPSLIEVYPLAALVRLMGVAKRPPYKTARSNNYWPNTKVPERIDKLLKSWSAIVACLKHDISELNFKVPARGSITRLSELKPYEDKLDAIISAYVRALYLHDEAEPFGDSKAAIWVPKFRQRCGTCNADSYLTAVQDTLSEWDSPSDMEAFRNL